MAERTCTIAECSKPVHSRDWCPMHYQRWRKNGSPDVRALAPPRRARRRVGIDACSIEGCAQPLKARGWCANHYSRWERYGSPTARVRGEIVDGKRLCRLCDQDKPVSEFSRSNDPCKACVAAGVRAYRKANPGWWDTPAFRAANAAYRARKYAATVEVFDPLEIFERDGWICGLCREPIDPSVPWPESDSPSLDHVIPLARGGEHSRANTQASHLCCNTAKRDRMP